MLIRPAQKIDAPHWARMRQLLWPSAPGEHASEVERYFNGSFNEPVEVWIALDGAARPIGFAEVSLRSHAEGCATTPVAHLEGWFVEPAARRAGVGRALIEAAETWASRRGCTEIGNTTSADAHQALGFAETARLLCFRKTL